MQQMLESYVRGGQPAITKTVYNPDTKLNEVRNMCELFILSIYNNFTFIKSKVINREKLSKMAMFK